MQKQIVNEQFLKRKDIYNIKIGGLGGSKGMIVVKDLNTNEIFLINKHDQRWLNGQLVSIMRGKIMAKDPQTGKKFLVDKGDQRWLNGQLVGINKGMVTVKDPYTGKCFQVNKNDSRWLNKQLISNIKGTRIGQKNPVYGKIWITNGIQSKHINKNQKIPQGWKRGRKIFY